MKTFILLFIGFLLFACSDNMNVEKDKAEIKSLLENESQYAANADVDNYLSCWANTNDVSFIYTDATGNQNNYGLNTLKEMISQAEPFELKLSRDNYHFVFGKDMAFVSYDQTDNWGGGPETRKKETRTLKKIEGKWKIVNTSVVDVSSFEKPQSESFHVQADHIQALPENGFRVTPGHGGMTIGYNEMKGPLDVTSLFKGLPHDMCNSPHWGYVLEGSLRLIYADGKEETVNAGEVFYWPAPHTGIVDKYVKFVDFSPDEEMSVLMDQISKNLASAKTSN